MPRILLPIALALLACASPAAGQAPDSARADPFLVARRLDEAGYDAEARKAVVEAVKADPSRAVPSDLHAPAEPTPWWVRWKVWAGIAVALGLIFLAWWGMRFLRPRLVIGEVDASGLDNAPGAGFAALIHHELAQLTRGAAHRGAASRAVQLVRGPVEGVALPAEVESALPPGAPWVGALLALVRLVVRRPVYTAALCLHRPCEDGAGVTLLLTRGSHLVASQTLWEGEFRPGGASAATELDPRWLAEAAAVWLLFRMAAHRRRWRREPEELVLVGTSDWRSYALFRAGVRDKEAGRDAQAERLYRLALLRDPANRAARANLGTLLSERGDDATAIEELEQTRAECAGTRDPVLYAALYSLAAAHYHRGAHEQALEPARTLVETIDRELASRPDPDWEAYLRGIEPSSRILYCGVAARTAATAGELAGVLATVDGMPQRADSSATHFNFACTYWIAARHECAADEVRRRCAPLALSHLGRALALRPALASKAEEDPVLLSLFDDVETGTEARALLQRHAPPPEAPVVLPVGADVEVRA